MVTLAFFLNLTVNTNPLLRNYNTTPNERAYVSNTKLYLIIYADVWSIDGNSCRISTYIWLINAPRKIQNYPRHAPELSRGLNSAKNVVVMPGFTLAFGKEMQQLPTEHLNG